MFFLKAIEENYKKNATDEFWKPIIIVDGDEGMIKGE